MLQQTQVATVIPYFERFLARFPDVHALAQATEEDVLQVWAGLGYYRRARQLHTAAKQLVAQTNGRFPQRVDQLQQLPGIGRYTAAAIASQAFDVPAGILEANTQRVYARLLALEGDPRRGLAQRILWQFAERLHAVGEGKAGELNQGLMELGSLICSPTSPACTRCPVADQCSAQRNGDAAAYGTFSRRPRVTELHHAALLIRRGNRWLMRQNDAHQWWTGLWDFPRIELPAELATAAGRSSPSVKGRHQPLPADVAAKLQELAHASYTLSCRPHHLVGRLTHSVTRFRIRLQCIVAEGHRIRLAHLPGQWKWVEPSAHSLPFTSTARRITQQILT